MAVGGQWPLTEGKGSRKDQQLRANRLGLAAGPYMLLGAEGVASAASALGLGISRSEATTAGLGMSAGDFLEWCNGREGRARVRPQP